jgi:DNA-binding PadR family transcriptional regulator
LDYHFESSEDIKLIILTVINDFNMPVSNAMIVDTVLTHSFAEYFDIQQYLYELTDAQLVTYYIEDSVRYYSLTQKGKETVGYFAKNIPHTVRERLFNTAKIKAKELRDSMSVQSKYYKENDFEYTVSLKIVERGYDLMNLKLSVGSEKIAKAICARFEKNSENVYTRIFSLLIDDNGGI